MSGGSVLIDATLKIKTWLRKHHSDVFERTANNILTGQFVNDGVADRENNNGMSSLD
jgi:hypothetical protein